jgi:hypothetical protein
MQCRVLFKSVFQLNDVFYFWHNTSKLLKFDAFSSQKAIWKAEANTIPNRH